MKLFRHLNPYHLVALLICLLFAVAGIIVSLHRFWQYEVWYYDFGIFDQAIRSVANFHAPIIDHFIVGGKWIWADHFNPGIFLLSPLYWFTNRSEILLIAQAVIVAASALVLYIISLKKLANHFLSLSVLISYVLFVGLQNAVITEFHELTILTLPLMLCFWAIFSGHKKAILFFLILCLSFKESLFTLGLGLSFFIYWFNKSWRKLSIITAAISLVWAVISIKFLIPYFSGGIYQYLPKTTGIIQLLTNLVYPEIKIKTVFDLFWSFLFLPLASLSALPIIFMNLVSRFLSEGSTRWDLGLHYNAEIAPTLAVGTILTLSYLQKRLPRKIMLVLGGLIILNSVILYRFVFHGPFALAYNPAFYSHDQSFTYLNNFLNLVPRNKSIMTQNNLAARFTDRRVWILRDNYPDYYPDLIVLDLRPEQNPNNFLGTKDPQKVFSRLLSDPGYRTFYHQNDQYIFERKRQ